MKIVVDFIPNHSSVKHPWFLASSSPSHPDHMKYKDYYVWVNGNSSDDLPNNWVSSILYPRFAPRFKNATGTQFENRRNASIVVKVSTDRTRIAESV